MGTRRRQRATGSDGGSGAPQRDSRGQFLPGNKVGQGNPHLRRLAEYRQALNASLTPEKVARIVDRLVKLADKGDVQAAKVLLERALGKAKVAPDATEPLDLGIDSLSTVEDVKKASQSILQAMTDGRLTPDDGAKLAAIVELVRRSIETQELETRIAALEDER